MGFLDMRFDLNGLDELFKQTIGNSGELKAQVSIQGYTWIEFPTFDLFFFSETK